MAQSDFLRAYKAQKTQKAAPQSSKGTGSSQSASAPPAGDVEEEVEEEVEDVTVAESVGQVPDPVALQQSRQAVAQKVLDQSSPSVMGGLRAMGQAAENLFRSDTEKKAAEARLAREGLLQGGKELLAIPGKIKEGLDGYIRATQYESLSPRARETQIVQLEQSIARMQEQLDRLKQIPSPQDRGRFEE
tara:strand:- start:268 stop:834 length:567 start_codon:yes stop_codon:yes gene_type:complete